MRRTLGSLGAATLWVMLSGCSSGADEIARTESSDLSSGSGYVGCFTDDGDRALPNFVGTGFTIESCRLRATATGHAYAGLQWYGECWVGDTIGYARVDDGECNTPCN